MKKSTKIILIVVLLVAVAIYFGAKIVLISTLPKLPDSFKDATEDFNNPETITIRKSTSTIENYLTFEDMKIRNDFENLENNGQPISTTYNIKDSDIRITISKEPVDSLLAYVKENAEVPNLPYNLAKDLDKNSIKTDYELYEYLVQNVGKKVNIFSSFQTIKRAHTLYNATLIIMMNIQKVTLIDGDYKGYIMEANGDKTAYIYHNEDSYFLHIWSKDYSDAQLIDLISTISFN